MMSVGLRPAMNTRGEFAGIVRHYYDLGKSHICHVFKSKPHSKKNSQKNFAIR